MHCKCTAHQRYTEISSFEKRGLKSRLTPRHQGAMELTPCERSQSNHQKSRGSQLRVQGIQTIVDRVVPVRSHCRASRRGRTIVEGDAECCLPWLDDEIRKSRSGARLAEIITVCNNKNSPPSKVAMRHIDVYTPYKYCTLYSGWVREVRPI